MTGVRDMVPALEERFLGMGKVRTLALAQLVRLEAAGSGSARLLLGALQAWGEGKFDETHGEWPSSAVDAILLGLPAALVHPGDRPLLRSRSRRAVLCTGMDEVTWMTAVAAGLLLSDLIWADPATAVMRARQSLLEDVPSHLLACLVPRDTLTPWPAIEDGPSTLQLAFSAALLAEEPSHVESLIQAAWQTLDQAPVLGPAGNSEDEQGAGNGHLAASAAVEPVLGQEPGQAVGVADQDLAAGAESDPEQAADLIGVRVTTEPPGLPAQAGATAGEMGSASTLLLGPATVMAIVFSCAMYPDSSPPLLEEEQLAWISRLDGKLGALIA